MGDFTEVLFAIGLLHYTLKHKVTPEDIINSINDIPSLPYENTFSQDNFDVSIHLDGKASVSNLIGGNFSTLADEHKTQVIDIANKISKHIPSLKTIHKVDQFVKQSKEMENSNEFIISIKSSGSKTAQQSEVKADVIMELTPKSNIPIPNDIKRISYSVKYSKDKATSKVSENGIFNLILRMGTAFKLPMTKGLEGMRTLPYQVSAAFGSKWLFEVFEENPQFKALSLQENHLLNFVRKIFTNPNDAIRENVLQRFILEFNEEMVVKEKQQPQFSTTLYDFLEKEIFGKDMADVVRIDSDGLKDIDIDLYRKIKNNYLIEFSTRPTKSKNLIFKFEAIAKDGSSFLLFWIDNHKSGTVQIHIGEDLIK